MSKQVASKVQPKSKRVGLSLAEVNAKFNPNVIIPDKIKAALKELGDNALPRADFRKLVGIGDSQLADFSDQFAAHLVTVKDDGRPKVLWCGTAAFAEKVREELSK